MLNQQPDSFEMGEKRSEMESGHPILALYGNIESFLDEKTDDIRPATGTPT